VVNKLLFTTPLFTNLNKKYPQHHAVKTQQDKIQKNWGKYLPHTHTGERGERESKKRASTATLHTESIQNSYGDDELSTLMSIDVLKNFDLLKVSTRSPFAFEKC